MPQCRKVTHGQPATGDIVSPDGIHLSCPQWSGHDDSWDLGAQRDDIGRPEPRSDEHYTVCAVYKEVLYCQAFARGVALAGTEKPTTPLPAPLAPELIVMKPPVVDVDQVQLGNAVTLMLAD